MASRSPGPSPDWYASYLTSPHWRTMRERKLDAVRNRCERCGRVGTRTASGRRVGLDVHHLTYERRGRERLSDLEVLCFRCHAIEHGQPADSSTIARRLEIQLAGEEGDEIDLEVAAWDNLAEEVDLGLA